MTDIEVITEETKAKSMGGIVRFLMNCTEVEFINNLRANNFVNWLQVYKPNVVVQRINFTTVRYKKETFFAKVQK